MTGQVTDRGNFYTGAKKNISAGATFLWGENKSSWGLVVDWGGKKIFLGRLLDWGQKKFLWGPKKPTRNIGRDSPQVLRDRTPLSRNDGQNALVSIDVLCPFLSGLVTTNVFFVLEVESLLHTPQMVDKTPESRMAALQEERCLLVMSLHQIVGLVFSTPDPIVAAPRGWRKLRRMELVIKAT